MAYCEGNLCLSDPSFLKRGVLDYFRKTLILRLNQRFSQILRLSSHCSTFIFLNIRHFTPLRMTRERQFLIFNS